jgi:hypothetical protein
MSSSSCDCRNFGTGPSIAQEVLTNVYSLTRSSSNLHRRKGPTARAAKNQLLYYNLSPWRLLGSSFWELTSLQNDMTHWPRLPRDPCPLALVPPKSPWLITSSTKSPEPVTRIFQVFCKTVFITVHGNFHIVHSVHCKSWKLDPSLCGRMPLPDKKCIKIHPCRSTTRCVSLS